MPLSSSSFVGYDRYVDYDEKRVVVGSRIIPENVGEIVDVATVEGIGHEIGGKDVETSTVEF